MCYWLLLQAAVLHSDTDDAHWEFAPYEEILLDAQTYLINVSLNSPAKIGQELRFKHESVAVSHSIEDTSWYKCTGENGAYRCRRRGSARIACILNLYSPFVRALFHIIDFCMRSVTLWLRFVIYFCLFRGVVQTGSSIRQALRSNAGRIQPRLHF